MAALVSRAWVLNLDADMELEMGEGWQLSRAVREHVARHAPAAARALLAPGDMEVREGTTLPRSLRGIPGRAFCPTPRAIAALRAAGAEPEPAPSVEVLRRVNHRRFCLELGVTLPGARFLEDADAVRTHLSRPPPVSEAWLLKRPFSVAGRGQRRVDGLDEAALRWAAATLRRGHGLVAEPHVAIEVEWVVHGLVSREGAVHAAAPQVQEIEGRAWVLTRAPRPSELTETEAGVLGAEVHRVGRALADAGYFGPFGIDAYRWRDRAGAVGLQPRSEINARHTMGWSLG